MPQPILLTRFIICQKSLFPLKSPSEWKVYGPNDEARRTGMLTSWLSGSVIACVERWYRLSHVGALEGCLTVRAV
jgi:hypothetical protein